MKKYKKKKILKNSSIITKTEKIKPSIIPSNKILCPYCGGNNLEIISWETHVYKIDNIDINNQYCDFGREITAETEETEIKCSTCNRTLFLEDIIDYILENIKEE